MAATCSWKTCEETEQNTFIVKFSNGNVKNAEELDFTVFKHSNASNPRKKNRRIVVADSDRLPYVGSNFGSGSLQSNNMCKYFVGVLDKQTMQMKVHSAQLFNMLPVIPGEATEAESENQPSTFRDKVDALIEAFGTNKQKRALSSRRLNAVGNETLHQAVAQAASNIIDQKGVEALRNEVIETEAQSDAALFLPPCNANADKLEDVYPFDQLLTPNEFESLKEVGAKYATLSSEDLQKMRDNHCPQTVLKHLETLSKDEADRDRQCRCAWYLSFVIRASLQKRISFKFGSDDGCPRIIINKVLKNFTVESFHNGSLRNTVSMSMRMKMASYCLALLLHMGGQTANLTLLHRDMSISENKMLEVAKAMGLTLSRQNALGKEGGLIEDEHRMVSLVLPLVHYDRRTERKKRKRMN
ncbi:DNA-directed RNA polymerase I subunit RPA49 [Danio rerio]|uniref:DNA-directed RNA polymerase I subunit RPA49 n=1 Tax=Danio rerio TaxID=7955 RepID=Q501W9_DANRE|nr:DNA-directed RNA polymerase I subunit RPA49 [Danio rerio]AAH95836.1 Polymerase (RNA) I polypeptide E [Danio rerio]AAI53551.1 Polymerase (RNA) I polypeptide E [Danio rerio]AAI64721.1 Polr1e protein [Danio rerio]|eukprot:NP_001018540.1 DNA-directed RNA polymerase I subunit RPA49 [Danio rerio]